MKKFAQISSFVVLLGVSTVLGLLGYAAEMGVSVTAGFLGLIFSNLDRIARFKGGGFEAEFIEKVEAVLEKEIEPDVAISAVKSEGYGLVGEDPPKVIRALYSDKYAWRYVSGISQESGVPRDKVENTLEWLTKNGLGKALDGRTGKIWALTPKGREVFAKYRS